VWKYAANTGPIILRAMRDIRPLKFFGIIALLLGALAIALFGVVAANYFYFNPGKTRPFTSLIDIGAALMTLSMVTAVLALLADMMARHRRITEELLYLARRRIYGVERVSSLPTEQEPAVTTSLNGAAHAAPQLRRVRPSKPSLVSAVHRSAEDEILEPGEQPARSVPKKSASVDRRRADNLEPVAAHAD
jgi:hypothetical protein